VSGPEASNSRQYALELRGITKRFGGIAAVEAVSIVVAPGEVLALIGENGAGKSTLIQVACGLYRADAGEIWMGGVMLPPGDPRASIEAGLGVVYQHFMLVGPISVWENIVLGREPRRAGLGGLGAALGLVDRDRARREVSEVARKAGLALDIDAPAETLSVGAQQRVEIVKQLWRGAKVLVLDEPTAVLSSSEAEELLRTVRGLAAEGRAVIFISHKLREVLRVADRVAVLRRGQLVLTCKARETSETQLAEAVLGAAASNPDAQAILGIESNGSLLHAHSGLLAGLELPSARPPPSSSSLEADARSSSEKLEQLKARGASASRGARIVARDLICGDERGRPALRGLSLELQAGEITGLAGVDGNGQTELSEVLCGLRAHTGTLLLDGAADFSRSPALARAHGVVSLPADRHRFALCLPLSLEENLSLGHQREKPWASGIWIDRQGRRARAAELLQAFDVRPPDPLARAGGLSGGNQQKLVAARELSRENLKLVVAVQPSRGLDFRATARVHQALRAARDAGAAVLVISLDLDELRALCSRIAVIFEGRIAGSADPKASDAELGRLMLGSAREPERSGATHG
jgi:ABC-type uncharacterized transport system ATPase subunit